MTGRSRYGGIRAAHLAVMAVIAVAVLIPGGAVADVAAPGSAGTDTSLPLTESKVTVGGRGAFAALKVTVNQTRNLTNQAVSVTWAGGTPTRHLKNPSAFSEHFLQLFQCWGDDDGTNAANPGPPPEQCQQGATSGVFGGRGGELFDGFTQTRILSRRGRPNFDPGRGSLDERSGNVSLPFRAVDAKLVPQQIDTSFNGFVVGGSYWLNPYFNIITTNEIAGARTSPDGSGAELFEVTTGLESTGLGCGQKVEHQTDGSLKAPRCWLVVVPRGGAAEENEGTGTAADSGVATSPLSPTAWKNRLAFPLEFNPVDSSCPLSAEQRRIVGSELLAAAVSSWQPALCATPGLSPYAYGSISDGRARQQLESAEPGAPGMAVMSRPLDPAALDPLDPVVYAPLSLSGTVLGFNIERVPKAPLAPTGEPTPEGALAGVRVAQLNLTPRLVAKLLTQSYRSQVEINSVPPYAWSVKNPTQLLADPDFLQFNPEFELLYSQSSKDTGGLVMASPSSDAALQVWEWVFSDPEARTWLAATPDPWGMNVNPLYSTSPSVNPSKTGFGDPLPDTYPKSDPYCYQAEKVGAGILPPMLCGLDWLPYVQGLRDAARATRAANDGAKTTINGFAGSPAEVYKSDGPQFLGSRGILSITDSASAARFGVQTARLSRAGDDTGGRSFAAPDHEGLAAGAASMTAKAVAGFLEPSPTTAPPGTYPLTALTYAAVTPLSLDPAARKEYAAFADYAAGPGQAPGFQYGQLPPGYEPLPQPLRDQGKAAAAAIRDLKTPDPPPDVAMAAPRRVPPLVNGSTPLASDTANDGPVRDPAASTVPGLTAPLTAPATETPRKGALDQIAARLRTPIDHLAASRYALPLLVVVACLSALGALEITKRRQG